SMPIPRCPRLCMKAQSSPQDTRSTSDTSGGFGSDVGGTAGRSPGSKFTGSPSKSRSSRGRRAPKRGYRKPPVNLAGRAAPRSCSQKAARCGSSASQTSSRYQASLRNSNILAPAVDRFGRGQAVKGGVQLDTEPPPMAVEVTAGSDQQRPHASPKASIRIFVLSRVTIITLTSLVLGRYIELRADWDTGSICYPSTFP